MPAMSPRQPAPRLVSTGVIDGTGPRKMQSREQAIALAKGFTLRAGPKTQARLHRGVIHKQWPTANEHGQAS